MFCEEPKSSLITKQHSHFLNRLAAYLYPRVPKYSDIFHIDGDKLNANTPGSGIGSNRWTKIGLALQEFVSQLHKNVEAHDSGRNGFGLESHTR